MQSVSGSIARLVRVQTVTKRVARTVVSRRARQTSTTRRLSTSSVSKTGVASQGFKPASTESRQTAKGANFVEDATERFAEIRRLHDEEKYEMVIKKFRELERHGVVPNKYAYLWALEAHAALNESSTCLDLLSNMKKSSVSLMPTHYLAVLRSLVPTGNVAMARALVDEFKQAGFRLQHFIVDAVTAVASTAADFRAAEEFLDLLPQQERSPVMYTNAMNAATHAGDAVEAFRLWKLAVKHFGDRNDISPAALINVLHCCLTNDYFDGVEAIIEHFNTVLRSSKALDEGIIMRVLEAAARSSPPRFAYAESIFTKFESIVGIKPPQEAFSAMLLIYANGRLLPRAFKFMSKMLPQGYFLHPAVAEMVADACSQPIDAVETSEERLENAFAVLDELRLSKLEHPIHVECLNVLILAAARVGDLNRAWEVFQELEKFDVKPNIASFNSLLAGAASTGNLEFVERTREAAKSAHVALNSMSRKYILLSFIQARDFKGAVKELKYYLNNNEPVSTSSFVAVVRALVQVHDLGRAMEVRELVPEQSRFRERLDQIINGTEYKKMDEQQDAQLREVERPSRFDRGGQRFGGGQFKKPTNKNNNNRDGSQKYQNRKSEPVAAATEQPQAQE